MELEKEYVYYQANKDRLVKEHPGKFVLIKGVQIAGYHSSEQKAYEDGLKRFGNQPFFITRVTREEEIAQYPALVLGILQ